VLEIGVRDQGVEGRIFVEGLRILVGAELVVERPRLSGGEGACCAGCRVGLHEEVAPLRPAQDVGYRWLDTNVSGATLHLRVVPRPEPPLRDVRQLRGEPARRNVVLGGDTEEDAPPWEP
jgi:hypothetical protein